MAVSGLLAIGAVVLILRASPPPNVAASDPPPPPTFVPTPIGPPPGPPVPTSTATPAATASTSATPGATTTATPTALQFSLDAARVAKVHNRGDFRGLLAVRRGSTVWLMMYYTLKSLPKQMTRLTTYTVKYHGKILFQISYKAPIKSADVGRRSRYTVYTIPRTASFGSYVYSAALQIGKRRQTKSWKFAVANHDRESSAANP